MKISVILWKAANEHLWDGGALIAATYSYSCAAAADAEGVCPFYPGLKESKAVKFLRRMGCDPSSSDSFNVFKWGQERQGARYAWLMFASMIAEEKGYEDCNRSCGDFHHAADLVLLAVPDLGRCQCV